MLSKIRSAKKSANLALDFEARKLGKSEPSKVSRKLQLSLVGTQ